MSLPLFQGWVSAYQAQCEHACPLDSSISIGRRSVRNPARGEHYVRFGPKRTSKARLRGPMSPNDPKQTSLNLARDGLNHANRTLGRHDAAQPQAG